jgi:hypothetical protein
MKIIIYLTLCLIWITPQCQSEYYLIENFKSTPFITLVINDSTSLEELCQEELLEQLNEGKRYYVSPYELSLNYPNRDSMNFYYEKIVSLVENNDFDNKKKIELGSDMYNITKVRLKTIQVEKDVSTNGNFYKSHFYIQEGKIVSRLEVIDKASIIYNYEF